ncbi:MAG: hypothetical protein Q4D98_05110 [Planctomycetia bacterium]|nr:hypothetical protein [Planctomycetia bacterium]
MKRNPHRGVVLLIVLALLAAFGITALTFLLTTGQLKTAAEQNLNQNVQVFSPEEVLNEGIMQVLRGPRDTAEDNDLSFPHIGQYNLLQDMYGSNSTATRISLTFTGGYSKGMLAFTGGSAAYVGRVITNVNEESASYGRSSVIVAFEGGTGYAMPLPDGTKLDSGEYLVNDLPFQGGNRDYDAADEVNLFLAARDPLTGKVMIPSFVSSSDGTYGTYRTSPGSIASTNTNSETVDADNDGYKDSVWMDLGLPVRATADGRLFKPMFAMVVEDLDGRLNVNTGGAGISTSTLASGKTNFSNTGFTGLGRGPAEISLESVGSEVDFVQERYSAASGSTGGTPDRKATSEIKGDWYANFDTSTIPTRLINGTPYDVRGGYSVYLENGVPQYSSTLGSDQVSTSQSVPYDLDLGGMPMAGISTKNCPSVSTRTSLDTPFSPAELEKVLRIYDFDSPYLPDRLEFCMDLDSNSAYASPRRWLVTTHSWHIPTVPMYEGAPLYSAVAADRDAGGADSDFLPELWMGMPVDLLRAATFDNSDNDSGYTRRQRFAKCLYNILKYLNSGAQAETLKRYAQWSVNVVDYLDADSVMTPFCYDGTNYVYGCERPELLISETFALHSRNTEENTSEDIGGKPGKPSNEKDTTVYESYKLEGGTLEGNGVDTLTDETKTAVIDKIKGMELPPDGEEDLDQLVRPQGSLYVELYNPWLGNDQIHPTSNDIYATDGKRVDLGKKNASSQSVWRLVVMQPGTEGPATQTEWNSDSRDETDTTGSGTFKSRVERIINMGSGDTTSSGIDGSPVVYHASANSANLNGGQFAVIGPTTDMALSYQDDKDGNPEVATSLSVSDLTGGAGSANGVWTIDVPASNGLRMSVTEIEDYGNETSLLLSKSQDKPIDKERDDWENVFRRNGITPGYRIVHLQRLANPNLAYNATTNPYITVDSMPVDLNVFNARASEMETDDTEKKELQSMFSRKRGEGVRAKQYPVDMIWQQEDWVDAEGTLTSRNQGCNATVTSDAGQYKGKVCVAFGKLGNNNYPFQTQAATGTTASFQTSQNFPWLTWLNRPPVSPYELMNVSCLSPNRLLYYIRINADTTASGVFSNAQGLTGYLGNFSDTNTTEPQRDMPIKVFDYLRVPSPQTVTPMVLNNPLNGNTTTDDTSLPFAFYSMLREPGRVNLNTIYSESVFRGLMNRPKVGGTTGYVYDPVSGTGAEGSNLWTQFVASRGGSESEPWTVTVPFRANNGAQSSGLLRSHPSSSGRGLFENVSTEEWNHTDYHPYFRYQQYYRMGNLATTRSNVFAVWVTMGLFEVDGDDGEPDLTRELGKDTGDTRRYRAFYIIDRSVPVGFERGKDWNAGRTILLRRMLQ